MVMWFTNVVAANFLFFWKASTDPSVTAYALSAHRDTSYVKIDEVSIQDLDNPANPSYLVAGLTTATPTGWRQHPFLLPVLKATYPIRAA